MNEDQRRLLEDLHRRLARAESRQRSATRLALGLFALGLVGTSFWWVPIVAANPPSNPLACNGARANWYCFAAQTPARASEINSNFEAIRQVTDGLASDVSNRLSTSGGAVNGNLDVNGTAYVGRTYKTCDDSSVQNIAVTRYCSCDRGVLVGGGAEFFGPWDGPPQNGWALDESRPANDWTWKATARDRLSNGGTYGRIRISIICASLAD